MKFIEYLQKLRSGFHFGICIIIQQVPFAMIYKLCNNILKSYGLDYNNSINIIIINCYQFFLSFIVIITSFKNSWAITIIIIHSVYRNYIQHIYAIFSFLKKEFVVSSLIFLRSKFGIYLNML